MERPGSNSLKIMNSQILAWCRVIPAVCCWRFLSDPKIHQSPMFLQTWGWGGIKGKTNFLLWQMHLSCFGKVAEVVRFQSSTDSSNGQLCLCFMPYLKSGHVLCLFWKSNKSPVKNCSSSFLTAKGKEKLKSLREIAMHAWIVTLGSNCWYSVYPSPLSSSS